MTTEMKGEGQGGIHADAGIVRAKPSPTIDDVLQRMDKIELMLNDLARIMGSPLRIARRESQ